MLKNNFLNLKLFYIIVLIIINSAYLSYGQSNEITLSSGVNSFDITPASLVTDLKTNIDKQELVISLHIGDDISFIEDEDEEVDEDDFSAQYDIEIIKVNDPENTAEEVLLETKTLLIERYAPKQVWVYDFTSLAIDDSWAFKIEAVNPTVSNQGREIYLKAEVRSNVRIDVRTESSSGNYALPTVSINPQEIGEINAQRTFSWNDNDLYFPSYQIQILRLYNTLNPNAASQQVFETKVNWDNALSLFLESSNTECVLSIAEGTGYYIWRVRPIGNFYNGSIANPLNHGAWSDAPAQGENINQSSYNHPSMFYFIEPESNKNWIYSRVFTEGNKTQEQIVYADGLNNAKQTQVSLSFEDNQRTVTGQVLDYSGRPAVQALPVPVSGSIRNNGYVESFIQNESGELYRAKDFDEETNVETPGKISQEEGANYDYYDGETGRVADAEGYAYSRVIYYGDGTGRPYIQTMPGKAHSLGNEPGMNHVTKVLYAKPTADELIRIFGNEAPDENKVTKTITIDPNNSISISYTNEQGKVIATCISHDPDNPEPNELLDVAQESQETEMKQSGNEYVNGTLKSTQRISLATETEVKINYSKECEQTDLGCESVSISCGYTLTISVLNLLTNTYELENQYIEGEEGYDFCHGVEIPITLTPGNYLITKELIVDNNKDAEIEIIVNDADKQSRPIVNMLTEWLSEVYNDSQLDAFFTKVEDFNTDLSSNTLDDYDFPSDFVPIVENHYLNIIDSRQNAYMITFQGCCGPIVIPIPRDGPSMCPSDSLLRNGDAENGLTGRDFTPDLSGYLTGILNDNENVTWADISPEYSPEEFDELIYNMLTDVYAYPDYTAEPKVQYACMELWECWIPLCETYREAKDLENTGGKIGDKSNQNEQLESDSPDTPVSSEDNEYDNAFNDNFPVDNWIVKWILKKKLSKKMREKEDSGEPFDSNPESEQHGNGDMPPGDDESLEESEPTETSFEYDFDIVKEFLDCVGYKFGGVIVRQDISSADFTGDIGSNNHNPNLTRTIESETDLDIYIENRETTEVFPYIYNKYYAYKYFEYEDHSNSQAEKIYCFSGPESSELSAGEVWIHGTTCIDEDYTIWDAGVVYDFYEMVKSSPDVNLPPDDYNYEDRIITCNDIETEAIDENGDPVLYEDGSPVTVKSRLQEKRTAQIESCHNTCEGRKPEFIAALYQIFEENCYIIDPACPGSDENIVTSEDINRLADLMVEKCKTDFCPVDDPDFNFCIENENAQTVVGYDYVLQEYHRFVNNLNPIVRALTDDEKEKIEVVRFWGINISVINRCEGETAAHKDWAQDLDATGDSEDMLSAPKQVAIPETATNP